jgi:hypothetical protein
MIVIIILIIILIMMVARLVRTENLVSQREDSIKKDISEAYAGGLKYMDYRAAVTGHGGLTGRIGSTSSPVLTPWQFERLMNLAKKNILTTKNINLIMGL